MSDIQLVSTGLPNLLPMQNRTQGVLHVSDIINDLCLRLGHYKPQESSMSRMQLGCALEDAIALRYEQDNPDRYVRLGELTLDGIPGTPDLYDTLEDQPVEIKLTWMSSRHDPATSDKFLKYWWQVGAYLKQTREILDSSLSNRLLAVHVNGDYKGFDVHANHWQRVWTKIELQRNWDMLRKHRDRMMRDKTKAESEA